MDEPCSALDPVATAKIEELLFSLKQDLDGRHCHPQYAAGGTGVRLDRVHVPWRHRGVWPHETALYHAGQETDRRLYYWTIWVNMMTQRHFDEELADLKTKLLRMAGQAEDQIDKALTALVTRDSVLAREVIERDHQVNALDVEIDEESIRLLALHQPAARDLRLVTTAMKIATELERISDLAENVCERAIELNEEPQLKPYIDIPMMGNLARMMVKQSIDAFVKDDAQLARKVLTDDDIVDNLMEQLFRELLSFMLEDTRTISRAIRLSFIAKYLERMADHATNIAELVVYLVEGKIIRHTTPSAPAKTDLAKS